MFQGASELYFPYFLSFKRLAPTTVEHWKTSWDQLSMTQTFICSALGCQLIPSGHSSLLETTSTTRGLLCRAAILMLGGCVAEGTVCPRADEKACHAHSNAASWLVRALGAQLLNFCWTKLTTELSLRRYIAPPCHKDSQVWSHLHATWESPRQWCAYTHHNYLLKLPCTR